MSQKTFYPALKFVQAQRRWHHLDAKGQVLGRLASRAAGLLKGKHKVFFTPSIDCGDFVVVTNAAGIVLTGHKMEQKTYFSHSGYAKGAKITPVRRIMERDPRKVVYLAVKRMLDSNRHRSRQLCRLRIYPRETHPHAPQMTQQTPQTAEAGRSHAG